MTELYHDTPLGFVQIHCSEQGITALKFLDDYQPVEAEKLLRCANESLPLLSQCANELDEYFSGKRNSFDVAIDRTDATDFHREVWSAVVQIPIGETRTYAQIAQQLNRPKAARAVGRANALNPLAILVPCHRLIGSDGKLRGYAYGLERKQALLDLEAKLF